MERPASETAGLFDDIQPQKAHISCWKALLAGGSQKKIIKKRYNFSGGFFIRQGFSTGSRHHLVERSCVWRLDVGGLFWHLFASKMLPSPDKSSTKSLSVFIMIREAEWKANQTPISCKGQELVFFQKMAIAQPVVIFQACCFAEKNSPYTWAAPQSKRSANQRT